ncbi:MAG: hypothetical protein HY393_01185 [Candidatus Diapherotrites archaeon]|nr:hypothetical protein [Candidatus Diapherotrites archaeon]
MERKKGYKTIPFLSLFIVLAITLSQPVFAQYSIAQPHHGFFWNGYIWDETETNGITVSGAHQRILTIEGTATSSYWNSEGRISKKIYQKSVQVEMALTDLPASASSASIWFTKDSQNALIVEKHRDVTDPQYNTNVFIVERINGVDHFKYVSADSPSANFDTYKIRKTPAGYETYYNGTLIYTGNLNLSEYNKVKLVGVARALGDQVKAQFRKYKEN